MQTVHQIATSIVAREGGFVNDPDDPGGATNFGVTIHTMRRIGLDLDRDGDVDVADVRALSCEHAVEIFVHHYFEKPRINLLPAQLHASVFDMYVNAGSNAVMILQRLLAGFDEHVTVDGALGPKTAEAAQRAHKKAGDYFADAYAIARRNYYFRLADRRVASRKYARTRKGTKGGWILRAEDFMRPQFHMSDTEFERRVAAWG